MATPLPYPTLDDLDVNGRTVLVRVDFNVPLDDDGSIASDVRIRAHMDTICELLGKGAKVVLLSHMGRPKGAPDPLLSLAPVAQRLEDLLDTKVHFFEELAGATLAEDVAALPANAVCLLENLRFHPGESGNAPDFARQLAALGDVYVNDAFGTAHRAHASTDGIPLLMQDKAIGRLMEREIVTLTRLLGTPARPFKVVIGGAKISTKINILRPLVHLADEIILGGAMANTILAAQGFAMGKSLIEPDYFNTARALLEEAEANNCRIILPDDLVVAPALLEDAPNRVVSLNSVKEDDMVLDIGPLTAERWRKHIADAATVLWNGPAGAFEVPPFDRGTLAVAESVAACPGFAVVGGGDTLRAIAHAEVAEADIDFVSTGGGAMLEFIEGVELPGLAAISRQ